MFPPSFFDHLEDRLNLAVHDTNQEYRMSVQHVTGLADIVRQTRVALASASVAAGDMQTTATSVMTKVNQVQALTTELKAAEAELTAAIGQLSNGGPPLETTTPSSATVQTSLPPVGPNPSYP